MEGWMLLATYALLTVGQATPARPAEEIVVTAPGPYVPDAASRSTIIRARVAALSANLPPDRPLARFHDPVCVQSVGLPTPANQAIEEGVRSVARSVTLRTGGAGCVPNVTVLFVTDPKATFDRLSRSRPLLGQTAADIRRIRAQTDAARVWIDTERRSRDGDRPSYAPNHPAILSTTMSSRISLAVRNDIVGAVVLIDRERVAGLSLTRIGDYIAYRALAGIATLPDDRHCSIATLFDSERSAPAPPGMSRFDRAYLTALYGTRADLPLIAQRLSIAQSIAAKLANDPEACSDLAPR